MAKKKMKKKAALAEPGATQLVWKVIGFVQARRIAFSLLLIALLGILVYAKTFRAPFEFDDIFTIVNNPEITSFSNLLDGPYNSRIVGLLSFALNYRLNGLNVWGYHVFNLTVHISSALLVFWFVILAFRTPFFQKDLMEAPRYKSGPVIIALFSGLLFVVHPIQTQAVTYTVQRFASLATLFYLLSLVLYVSWRLKEKGSVLLYLGAIAAAILAMSTKEMTVTLPVIILLFEGAFFAGNIKRRLINLLPFFLTMLIVPLGLKASNVAMLSAEGDTPIPAPGDYLFTEFRVIVTYLRLLLFPAGQNLDYDYPVYHSFTDPNVFLSLFFLLAIAGTGIFIFHLSREKSDLAFLRLAAFGIFWFFITLSVESSVIPIADVIFEHRLYLPSIGFIIAVVTGGYVATAAIETKIPWIGKAAIPVLSIVVLMMAGATYARNSVWGDEVTLWSDVVKKSPAKDRPHFNLGTLYLQRGDTSRAAKEFEADINIRPDYAAAHLGLGDSYLLARDYTRAAAEFLLAVRYDPDLARAHNHLGLAYLNNSETSKAIAEFERAISLNPDYAEAHLYLGAAYMTLRDNNRAYAEFEEALRINPDFQEAKDNIRRLQSRGS